MMKQVKPLDAATYKKHAIHGDSRTWIETNCYVDIIVELLHGLGYEPIAALPFTLCIDFEGDQWTFFKFPHEDLYTLYNLELQEFNPWRSLVEHVDTYVGLGRPVLVEMDSYFLPDTVGSAYKIKHEKTTIAVNAIDIDKRFMGYFHNQSYHELKDQDFVDIFQLEGLVHERMLPPYIEYVKQHEGAPLQGAELVNASLQLLKRHLQRVPEKNPFFAFKEKFSQDFEWLRLEDIETFHAYSFATLRQYGACFELVETYLNWLQQNGAGDLQAGVGAFSSISNTAKAFQFQLARAMSRKKDLDLSSIDAMAEDWERGMASLRGKF